ncbi:MAG: HNH endonuclease [Candidatus Limnocylindrus sp.]
MPSKPRTLAGILRPRCHADRAYNRDQRDPAVARVHGSARWQAVRAQVLRAEPLCRACARAGRTELATQVDHVVPLDVDLERAYDPTNLQPLCSACHGEKCTAERQGEGGASGSSASRPPSGARGVSLFSRDSGNARNGPRRPDSGPWARTQPAREGA